jgi:hypothetical protein
MESAGSDAGYLQQYWLRASVTRIASTTSACAPRVTLFPRWRVVVGERRAPRGYARTTQVTTAHALIISEAPIVEGCVLL